MVGVTVEHESGDSSRAKTLRTGKTHAALRISLEIRDNGALHTSFKGVISQDFEPNVCTDRVKPIKKRSFTQCKIRISSLLNYITFKLNQMH